MSIPFFPSQQPRHFSELSASKRLEIRHEEVLRVWEERVRKAVPPAASLEYPYLLDSLPAFLENLAVVLRSDRFKPEQICYENICANHGKQRAEVGQYELPYIFTEYKILRKVLFETLEIEGSPLRPIERDIINRSIHLAMDEVTSAFIENSRKTSGEKTPWAAKSDTLLQSTSGIFGLLAMAIGITGLIGWSFGIASLYSTFPGLPIMSATAALSLWLSGFSVFLFRSENISYQRYTVGHLAAFFSLLLALSALVLHSSWPSGLYSDGPPPGARIPGIMSANTSITFILCNSALIIINRKHRGWYTLAQSLALITLALSGWTLTAYFYGIISGEYVSATQMSLNVSTGFVLLSFGILFSRPDLALMSTITSPEAGGFMARRLILAAIVFPLFVGALRLRAQVSGYIGTTEGTTASITITIIFFVSLIWWIAKQLNQIDVERHRYRTETHGAIRKKDQVEIESQLRELFISTLSHDLRSPLSAAKAYAEIGVKFPDKAQDHPRLFRRISESIERADQMIRDLLDVNRLRAGQTLPIEKTDTELKGLIERTLEELSFIHGKRFVFQAEKEIRVQVSPDALRRILENLCSNAVKYGDPEIPVVVTLETIPEEILIHVHNRGRTIPPEERARIFEPFHRIQTTESGVPPTGWGLGLTLVQGLAHAHGGKIEVRSSWAEGTTFTVRLPRDTRPGAFTGEPRDVE